MARMRNLRQSIPLLLLPLALLAGGCSLFHRGAAPAAAPVRIVQLKSTVVNLADAGGASYLRIGVALALTSPVPAGTSDADTTLKSVASDTVVSLASARTSSQLLAPNGKTDLKHAILAALQHRLPQAQVSNVYFDDFLVQQ